MSLDVGTDVRVDPVPDVGPDVADIEDAVDVETPIDTGIDALEEATCTIAGVTHAAGAKNPENPCQRCDLASLAAWTAVSDGEICGDGRFCSASLCAEGCWIDGALVPPGATSCRECDPAKDTLAWSTVADGESCGLNQVCLSGDCLTAMTVQSIAPTCASNLGGDLVTIAGSGFESGVTVTIAGSAAAVTLQSSQALEITVPSLPGITGVVPVSVESPSGMTASPPQPFRVFNGVAFRPLVKTTTPGVPSPIAVGDLDGDGKDDVAFVSAGGFYIKRVGTLDGNFTYESKIAGCSPSAIAIFEATGDGIGDLVMGCIDGIRIYAGVAGSGPSAVPFATFAGDDIAQIVPGHFDTDPYRDFAAVAHGGATVLIYNGSSDGSFTAGVTIPLGEAIAWLDVGDITGDGLDDVAVAQTSANKLIFAVCTGNGAFATPVAVSVDLPQTIHLARIDGDNLADVVVSSNDAAVSGSYFISQGAAALGPRVNLTGGGLTGAAVGDFNDDDLADVLVNGGGGIRVFPGNGDGTFDCMLTIPAEPEPQYLQVGDLDGNGRLDIVGRNASLSFIYFVLQDGP